MRTRTYGLLMLGAVGIAPLAIFGYLATARSQRTTVDQVRAGNQRAAAIIAERITQYMDGERRIIAIIGMGVLAAVDPEQALRAFQLGNDDVDEGVVYDATGRIVAGRVPAARSAVYADMARDALAGTKQTSGVIREPTEPVPTVIVAVPLVFAGARVGAIVARYSLIGVWSALEAATAHKIGFSRVMTRDGELIAHANRDEARHAFNSEPEANRRILEDAEAGHITRDLRGQLIVGAAAEMKDYDWFLVVEQSVEQAYAATWAMKRAMVILALAALLAVVIAGVVFGRVFVRGIERLRAHTRVLAVGQLETRADTSSRLDEVRSLAESLNEMAASLRRLQDDAQARERLATFARVAAGLAHDLRAPIEAVRGACEQVSADAGDDAALELLRTVTRRELPRLKRFVDDLQRLAKQGSLALEYAEVAPRALVQDIVDELIASPKWRGVEIVARGEAAPVLVDRNLLRRAVLNLAANGADACLERGRSGQVVIEVTDALERLEIRVSDTGTGIPGDRLAGLLQGDFRSSKRSSGVGLGLGVAKQVAEAHGGHLLVDSTVGVGSTFRLEIPRTASEA